MEYIFEEFVKCTLSGDWILSSGGGQWLYFIHNSNNTGIIDIVTAFNDIKMEEEFVRRHIRMKASSEIRLSHNVICYREDDIENKSS